MPPSFPRSSFVQPSERNTSIVIASLSLSTTCVFHPCLLAEEGATKTFDFHHLLLPSELLYLLHGIAVCIHRRELAKLLGCQAAS